MNTFQEKVKQMALDYVNSHNNAEIPNAYFDGAMDAFELMFGVHPSQINENLDNS